MATRMSIGTQTRCDPPPRGPATNAQGGEGDRRPRALIALACQQQPDADEQDHAKAATRSSTDPTYHLAHEMPPKLERVNRESGRRTALHLDNHGSDGPVPT
jgi:hypothetical protein